MNSFPRFIGLSVLLLLAFLVAAFSAPRWLQRQTQLARADVVKARRALLDAAVRTLPRPADPVNDAAYRQQLEALVGGSVAITRTSNGASAPTPDAGAIAFEQRIEAGDDSFILHVTLPVPPALKLLAVYQRATVALLLFGSVLLWVVALLAILTRRTAAIEGSRTPWQRTRAEMGSFEQLAKTSADQRQALASEQANRRRAEEDAMLKEGLLHQSLEARIGLGRDLHDGIIQSLYAVGLMLESARALTKSNPAEADRRLEQCCENLNSTIREVRAYITGLAPEHVQRRSFTQALESLLRELSSGGSTRFDLKVDDEAAALLSSAQMTESLQIAREAVSNAIRHGGASVITLRLHKSDREICLLVQDNGTGFDSSQRRDGGHGLGNMHARAQRLGATTTITSQRGEGTRVVVTLPVLQVSHS